MNTLSYALSCGTSREASTRGGAHNKPHQAAPASCLAAGGAYGRPQGAGRSCDASVHGGRRTYDMRVGATAAECQAGSWAKRMTTFAVPQRCDSAEDVEQLGQQEAQKEAQLQGASSRPHGPVPPQELAAALRVLAASNHTNVIVGDCEFATKAASCRPPTEARSLPAGGSGKVGLAACSILESGLPAGLLCEHAALADMACSGPTRPRALALAVEASSLPRVQSLAFSGADPWDAQLEWQQRFQQRWKAVRKRAFLQGLGLRSLWKVHSPSDRHEPLELLTNELPVRPRLFPASFLTGPWFFSLVLLPRLHSLAQASLERLTCCPGVSCTCLPALAA